MHLLPEIILAKQTYNSTPPKKHPSLETFSLTNLPPNSELANGSVTRVSNVVTSTKTLWLPFDWLQHVVAKLLQYSAYCKLLKILVHELVLRFSLYSIG